MKLKLNNRGFSPLILLVVVVIIGAILGVGWYVYSTNNKQSDTTNERPAQTQQTEQSSQNNEITKDNTIVTLNGNEAILLFKPQDVNKLPSIAPDSFKQYMKTKLANQKPINGCSVRYEIVKVSQVNISGGQIGVGADGNENDTCGGGAAIFWYIDGNTWKEYGTQDGIDCKQLDKIKLYSEFVDICVESNDPFKEGQNPNGSLKDR